MTFTTPTFEALGIMVQQSRNLSPLQKDGVCATLSRLEHQLIADAKTELLPDFAATIARFGICLDNPDFAPVPSDRAMLWFADRGFLAHYEGGRVYVTFPYSLCTKVRTQCFDHLACLLDEKDGHSIQSCAELANTARQECGRRIDDPFVLTLLGIRPVFDSVGAA